MNTRTYAECVSGATAHGAVKLTTHLPGSRPDW